MNGTRVPAARSLATSAALLLIVGGSTLSSYYVYAFGLSVDLPLCAAGAALLLLVRPRVFLDNRALALALGVAGLLALWLLVPMQHDLDLNAKAYGGTAAGLVLWALVRYATQDLEDQQDAMVRVVKIVVFGHLAAFAIQFLAFHAGGMQIEFLSGFTGRDIRLETSSFSERGSLFRATGLFNEPGTYSVHMLGLVWMLLAYRDYRMDVLTASAVASVVLTFSAFGIIAVGVLMGGLIVRSLARLELRRAMAAAIVVGVCAAPLGIILFDYLAGRFLSAEPDASYATRVQVLSYIASRDWLQTSVGDGFAWYPLDPDVAVNDASVFAWLLLTLGAVGAFTGLALIANQGTWMGRLCAILVLVSKLSPTHPFLFVVFALQKRPGLTRPDVAR